MPCLFVVVVGVKFYPNPTPNFYAKLGYSKTDTITLPWENEAHIYEKTLLRTRVLTQSAR
jgi:hypothetical protein